MRLAVPLIVVALAAVSPSGDAEGGRAAAGKAATNAPANRGAMPARPNDRARSTRPDKARPQRLSGALRPSKRASLEPAATASRMLARARDERGRPSLARLATGFSALAAAEGFELGLVVAPLDGSGSTTLRKGNKLFNPASNTKFASALLALETLGPDHRFETVVRRAGRTLVIEGAFDPSITQADLERLAERIADHLRASGVRDIGDVVIDQGRLRGPRVPSGFEAQRREPWPYLATPAPLVIDRHAVQVRLTPGKEPGAAVEVDAGLHAGAMESRVRTGPPDSQPALTVVRRVLRGRPILTLRGTVPATGGEQLSLRHPDPGASTRERVAAALRRAGVTVTGRVRTGKPPRETTWVASHLSPPLVDLVQRGMEDSLNLDHEMFTLAAAAELRGNRPVTLRDGKVELDRFLRARVGLSGFRVENGSGLGGVNRLSAEQILELIRFADRSPRSHALLGRLPTAGRSGTLSERMKGTAAAGRVLAKTGTDGDALALSGIVSAREGQPLAFALLLRLPQADRQRGVDLLDAIAIALATIAP